MSRFLVKRGLHSMFVLWGVLTLTFFLIRFLGNPVKMMLAAGTTTAGYNALRDALGLNLPVTVQYVHYLSGVIHGQLGTSYWQLAPVTQIIFERLPETLLMGGTAFVFSILVSVPLGVLAAIRPGSVIDTVCNFIAIGSVSIPDFWYALMLILVFSVSLHWLPTGGYGSPAQMVMPVLTLSLRPVGRIALVCRSQMIEKLGDPYLRAVRAKGVPERRVVYFHCLKNALGGVIAMAGLELDQIIMGYSPITETIYALPGIGSLAYGALVNADFPLIQGIVIFSAVLILVINLLVDIMCSGIDPRLRYQ